MDFNKINNFEDIRFNYRQNPDGSSDYIISGFLNGKLYDGVVHMVTIPEKYSSEEKRIIWTISAFSNSMRKIIGDILDSKND